MGLFPQKKPSNWESCVSYGLKGKNAFLRGHVFYCCRLVHGPLSDKTSPLIKNHTCVLFSQRRKRTPSRFIFLFLQAIIWGSFRKRALKLRIIFVSYFLKGGNAFPRGNVSRLAHGALLWDGALFAKKALNLRMMCVYCFLKGENALLRGHVLLLQHVQSYWQRWRVCVWVCVHVCVSRREGSLYFGHGRGRRCSLWEHN